MQHHVKFRPTVHVYYDEDNGQFTMTADWSDACDGEYEIDDDGDEVGAGYGDASDQAWMWIQNLMAHYPVLKAYPDQPQPEAPTYGHQVNPGELNWATVAPGTATATAGLTTDLKAKLLMVHKPFDTCQHYVPSEQDLAEGCLVPEDHVWPYNTYLPYGACTNPKIVGPGGIGPCHMANGTMPKCNGYETEAPVTLGTHPKTTAPTTVTITRRRVGLGRPEWSIQDGENPPEVVVGESIANTHAKAIEQFHHLTGQLPVNPVKIPKQGKPFIADLVGANAG